jgi:hypothetical protein
MNDEELHICSTKSKKNDTGMPDFSPEGVRHLERPENSGQEI